MTNLEKYNHILKVNLNISEICLCDEVLTYKKIKRWTNIIHNKIISDLETVFQIHFSKKDVTAFTNYSTGIAILKEHGIDMHI